MGALDVPVESVLLAVTRDVSGPGRSGTTVLPDRWRMTTGNGACCRSNAVCGVGKVGLVHGSTPEKSSHQLVVWRQLVDALDQLEVVWRNIRVTVPRSSASSQLPANVATALAKATERGTRTIAEVTDVLVTQLDSGAAFRPVAVALRQALDEWPER